MVLPMALLDALKRNKILLLLPLLAALALAWLWLQPAAPTPTGPTNALELTQTIPLPGVTGRIDHLALDPKNRKLFVAALGHDSVEVIDLDKGQDLHSISGLSEPQGIVFIPEFNRIYVANGGSAEVDAFDADTFAAIKSARLDSDADNAIYDESAKRMYVGYGNGGIAVIDPATLEITGTISFGGHPESFRLQQPDHKLFVNVPAESAVYVLDPQNQAVIAKWTLTGARQNFPLALDEGHHRLFVGSRDPAKLTVLDTDSGKTVDSLGIVQDADDVFYDAARQRIYVSGGEGFVDVVKELDADHYELEGRMPTAAGARTALFSPELNQFYVAVPQSLTQPAQIRVYAVK